MVYCLLQPGASLSPKKKARIFDSCLKTGLVAPPNPHMNACDPVEKEGSGGVIPRLPCLSFP